MYTTTVTGIAIEAWREEACRLFTEQVGRAATLSGQQGGTCRGRALSTHGLAVGLPSCLFFDDGSEGSHRLIGEVCIISGDRDAQ